MAVRAIERDELDQEPDPSQFLPDPPPPAILSDGPPPLIPEGDIELLGTLVVDRVAEIVELRQALADQSAMLAQLRAEVAAWRTRALTEAAERRMDAEAARRHERELVSEIHRRMIEIDVLTAQLAWRRRAWFRRVGRRGPAAVATPDS